MKLALKHVLTAIILILSLAAPVAAGPHEDARAATGYRPGFNPYTGVPAPLPPPGVDAHAIDKNGLSDPVRIRSHYRQADWRTACTSRSGSPSP
jgi:hypothetical protein